MTGYQACEHDGCGKQASVMDTRVEKVLCSEHRTWPCPSCPAEHQYLDLQLHNEDFERWLHCPRTMTVLQMHFHTPYAARGRAGYEAARLCSPCYGMGRCICASDLVGDHERCLLCNDTKQCHHCAGSGLADDPSFSE